MKHIFCWQTLACIFSLLAIEGCFKRNFFEDPDDPGLSRFTSRGYDVVSAYVNSDPWTNQFSTLRGPAHAIIHLDSTAATRDTLYITWQGSFGKDSVLVINDWHF